jgi:CheY-like chemotaxis protein
MEQKKVLVAEDDEDDQKLFHDFLQHRTDILLLPMAENGIQLFEMLETIYEDDELPHLIVLDQNMPKRTGLKTLQLLKEHSRYAGIPVMIYSTYTDQELIRKGTELGAAVVASKPISKEGYNEMMETFLKVLP